MNHTNETMQVMTDDELAATDGAVWGWVVAAYEAIDQAIDFVKGYNAYQPSHEVVWSTISYE